jgi:tetratricopeptide (TPR) repeat protein
MGTVHLAEVTEDVAGLESGRKVAVKVVHPHLLASPGFFKRFMREAELGRKVMHENVVRTFDVDALLVDDKHVNFMVMEHVEGKDLRARLNDLGTVPEALLREIALQATAGLCAIHASDIVHRDIKPENILITDTQEVRIMDLGVAKLQEASIAITKEGHFAGSLLYAAPEQFRKDAVDARADLYSLGVLLYELATGRNPFRSDDASAVIQAHLTERPPPAHERNEELSFFFSEVVATLLAKQPADRFASAEALQTVLAEAERSTWWVERAPVVQEQRARLPRIRVSRETKLHGRGADLEALQEAWGQARNGDGNTVLLEGEAGIGKTRLVDAFLRGIGEEDLHVLYGSYPPSGGMGGFSEAILGKFGETRLADALTPYLTVTPSLVPTFAALVKHASPPTGAEPLGGDALQAVVVHLMRALAAEKPTVWIMDDLQFAPPETHDFLLAMARAVEDHRVLLVATARPGLALEDFSRLKNFRRVSLGRLGGRDIVHLLADAFQSEPLAEKLGGKIAVKSDGVPFFVFEMIRGLKEGQFIRQAPDGSYVQTQGIGDIEVPSAVKDLIEGRMRGLTKDERAILDAGAVCGMTFDPGLVAHVLEEKRVRVLRELAEIERRSGLVRGEAGQTRFDQNQIQEVLYQDLPPDLRAEYHTLLAEAYAERCGERPGGDDAVFLVHHHLRGSRPGAGWPHLTPALEHLEESFRNEEAIDLASRALQSPRLLEGKERVEVLLRMAERHGLRGEREKQRTALDEALAPADEGEDAALRARVRSALSAHFLGIGDYPAAQESAERALDLAREADEKATEAVATQKLGMICYSRGRHEEARANWEKSLALSHEIGDRLREASATGSLGGFHGIQGRHEEARAHHERHLALSREIGDRRGEAVATGNLGNVFLDLGRYEEARAHGERDLALSREIGDRQGETLASGNLGNLCERQGRYEEARAHLERCLALSREMGDRHTEAKARGGLAVVGYKQGCHEEARAHAEKCLAVSREIGDPSQESDALASLGWLAETEGETETARRLLGEALALQREMDGSGGVVDALAALGRMEWKRGDPESAVAHLEEALTLAREATAPLTGVLAGVYRALLPGGNIEGALAAFRQCEDRVGHTERMEARIRFWELTQDKAHLDEAHRLLRFAVEHAPEERRDSMIENVPLHRDILKAWEEHGGV